MDESLFKELVERWVSTTNATLEDKSEEQNYLFNSLLRLQLSVDHKFSAVSGKNTRVTADIVAMDSDLPLKSRGSLETYNGKIPKIGIQKYLKESDLSEIDILVARNAPESTIAAKIFDDYTACVVGAREKVEYMTHQMASNGIVETPSENKGRSIRVDYGVPDANRFGVAAAWSDPAADIAGDLETVYTAAVDNGDSISLVRMNRVTFNQVKKNESVINLYKGANGFASDSSVTLNQDKVNELFMSEFGFSLQIIDRAFQVEDSEGNVTNKRAWAEGAVSFWTTDGVVGDLVYADLAEKTRPVKAKVYSQPAEWLLAAKWSEGNPLREFSEASGLVMPVLNNVDHVYFLDTATVELD